MAWWQIGHVGWALGAVLMIANWPVTFFAIMPTNNKLMVIEPAMAGPESRAMIERWGSLHMARTALGFAASLAFPEGGGDAGTKEAPGIPRSAMDSTGPPA